MINKRTDIHSITKKQEERMQSNKGYKNMTQNKEVKQSEKSETSIRTGRREVQRMPETETEMILR